MAATKRIGALVPATNPVVEPDFYRVLPPEITVHFERMFNGDWATQPKQSENSGHQISISSEEAATVDTALFGFDADKMNEDVSRGARSLSNHTPVHTSLVNVPGSQDPLYFRGARLEQTYGVVPLRGEQGIAISSMSYDGKMCISINADSDLVPEVAKFEGALTQALDELMGAASNLGENARPLRAVPSS